jgi:hypothetical protein
VSSSSNGPLTINNYHGVDHGYPRSYGARSPNPYVRRGSEADVSTLLTCEQLRSEVALVSVYLDWPSFSEMASKTNSLEHTKAIQYS